MTEETLFEEVDSMEEQFDSMDDLAPKFIRSPKVGEKVEFTVKGFNKVTEKSELEFSFEKNGKQKTASNALSSVDFGIKITTTDGAIYWVSSWSIFGQIKAIAKKINSGNLKDVELQIDHVANGMIEEHRLKAWIVRTKIKGAWKQLDKDTNDWV